MPKDLNETEIKKISAQVLAELGALRLDWIKEDKSSPSTLDIVRSRLTPVVFNPETRPSVLVSEYRDPPFYVEGPLDFILDRVRPSWISIRGMNINDKPIHDLCVLHESLKNVSDSFGVDFLWSLVGPLMHVMLFQDQANLQAYLKAACKDIFKFLQDNCFLNQTPYPEVCLFAEILNFTDDPIFKEGVRDSVDDFITRHYYRDVFIKDFIYLVKVKKHRPSMLLFLKFIL